MKHHFYLISILCLMLFNACKKENIPTELTPIVKEYLHLSHTRTSTNPTVIEEVNVFDFSDFDMLWLGGDLAEATSVDEESLLYIDSIFDIRNPNTLWALGNHDYSDLASIQTYTNRLPYFSYHANGITVLALDTQDDFSNIVGEQKDFFNQVLDTLEMSSHLIILHHKLIWMYNNTDLAMQISGVSNGELGSCFYCLNPNNFYEDIYPRLVEIKEQGIEVICIGGDIGFNTNEFDYTTAEGIHFLASGIAEGRSDNQCLVFQHYIEQDSLAWKFKQISDF